MKHRARKPSLWRIHRAILESSNDGIYSVGSDGITTFTSPRRSQLESRALHRLLVVEDNVVNQEVAVRILQHLGYTADLAGDAPTALGMLREKDYSVVLLDCQLPEIDGFELCGLIRDPSRAVRNPRIPIVAVTANALTGDRERCLQAGMDDYITKPVSMAALEEVLKLWTAKATTPLPPPESLFDSSGLLDRMIGNEDIARRVVARFVEDVPLQLAALTKALGNADAPGVRFVAHSIKGAAANAGGDALRNVAAQLEALGEAGDLPGAAALVPRLSSTFNSLKPLLERFRESGA